MDTQELEKKKKGTSPASKAPGVQFSIFGSKQEAKKTRRVLEGLGSPFASCASMQLPASPPTSPTSPTAPTSPPRPRRLKERPADLNGCEGRFHFVPASTTIKELRLQLQVTRLGLQDFNISTRHSEKADVPGCRLKLHSSVLIGPSVWKAALPFHQTLPGWKRRKIDGPSEHLSVGLIWEFTKIRDPQYRPPI